ncbi:MAG: anthranilate phosphoribosyltransferase [Bacteroidetes bacterium]|uniref:Anthranilate phosphoribosyltransferase n=1 Tax=Candidatus Enterocola intestinipullorum TaxID=2840783 RepID=A0A9D9EGN3_9BACT|nr:anthranilate phosphoribosyltransferase [Candidatus Enterocola intestinipullorum]
MKNILYRLFENEYLDKAEAKNILTDIADGKYEEAQVAALITVFLMRNISVDELCGFRDALMQMRLPVDLSEYEAIDIVGTGGDGKNTFNISTAACFVVAGAGYKTVKHGNYGATSVSGASNVMESHGVKFTADAGKLRRSMEECGIAYLHAPLFNPALKAVAPVRKHLAVRSFFNLLGPLVNPACPAYQLLGVYNLPLLRLYNYTYEQTGIRYGIVNSLDGYDEISLTGEFKFSMDGFEKIYTPESIGLGRTTESGLSGGASVKEAARIFDNVLTGNATEAQSDCVIANAGFAIRVICPEKSIADCLEEAREGLKSGKALAIFKHFLELNS